MRPFHRLGLLLVVAVVGGCSTPVVEEQLDSGPPLTGKIVNIVEVDEGAGFGKQLAGSLIGATVGSAIGGGTGKSIAIGVGAVAGAKVADGVAGKLAHRLTLRTPDGTQYECLVHGHGFMMNDEVYFTVSGGDVTSIAHKSLIDSRNNG